MSLTTADASPPGTTSPGKPRLLFFHSPTDGRCRRGEGHLDQVLQRRGNHRTFAITRVNVTERPDLAQRFHVDSLPTIIVIENDRGIARLKQPRGAKQIHEFLGPWLR